jgi:hypothetical protein
MSTAQQIYTIITDNYPQLDDVDMAQGYRCDTITVGEAALTITSDGTWQIVSDDKSMFIGNLGDLSPRGLAHNLVAAAGPSHAYHVALTQGPDGWEVDPMRSSLTYSKWHGLDGVPVSLSLNDNRPPVVTVHYYDVPITLRGASASQARQALEDLYDRGLAYMVDAYLPQSPTLEMGLALLDPQDREGADVTIETRPTPLSKGKIYVVRKGNREHPCVTVGQVVDTILDTALERW